MSTWKGRMSVAVSTVLLMTTSVVGADDQRTDRNAAGIPVVSRFGSWQAPLPPVAARSPLLASRLRLGRARYTRREPWSARWSSDPVGERGARAVPSVPGPEPATA